MPSEANNSIVSRSLTSSILSSPIVSWAGHVASEIPLFVCSHFIGAFFASVSAPYVASAFQRLRRWVVPVLRPYLWRYKIRGYCSDPFVLACGRQAIRDSSVQNISFDGRGAGPVEFSSAIQALSKKDGIRHIAIGVGSLQQLELVSMLLRSQSVDTLFIDKFGAPQFNGRAECLASLVQIPRQRLVMKNLCRGDWTLAEVARAINEGLQQNDSDGVPRPRIEMSGGTPRGFQNVPHHDVFSSLSCNFGPSLFPYDDYLVSFAEYLQRTNLLDELSISLIAHEPIRHSTVQHFRDGLESNKSLRTLEISLGGYCKVMELLTDGILPALQFNRRIGCLFLTFYGTVGEDLTPVWNALGFYLPVLEGLRELAMRFRDVPYPAPPSSFHRLIWGNGSLCKFEIKHSAGVEFAGHANRTRLMLRNELLKSARQFVVTNENGKASCFVRKLTEINKVPDDKDDFQDVTLSALYEVTRNVGPQVIRHDVSSETGAHL